MLAGFVGAAILCATSIASNAQTYPSKPVKLVIPTGAGGTSDVLGRVIAQKLSTELGQPVVVENKGGANGNIGAAAVAKSPNDGYTLLLSSSLLSGSAGLYKNLQFNPSKDFAPISQIATTPYFLVAGSAVPAGTVRELIALAKATPGRISYASVGVGSGPHLTGELFAGQTGVNLLHVPFTGAGQAATELIGGRVQIMFVGLPPVLGHVKAGRMKILGVAEPERSRFLPDTPTIAESGVPRFEANAWFGLFAPAGTPPAIVQQLAAATAKVLKDPTVAEQFTVLGAVPVSSTPEDFKSFYEADIAKLGNVIRAADIHIE